MALARCTSATSTISMATMFSSSSSPAAVPRTMASMVLSATWPISILPMSVALAAGTGTISMLISSAAGAPDDRGDQDMAGDVGNGVAQNGGVEHEDGAGDAGHAAGHHHEQFAAREPRRDRAG